MLKHLYLRDFAIVETLALDLNNGLTVLTGETGAGKSIIIDALGLVLGDRGESGIVRYGSTRTEITAEFDISNNSPALAWMTENDLDSNTECLMRRTISSDGRSKSWINGTPVALHQLRSLGDLLVDIHGQHEHQRLLKREHQREMLDSFGGLDKEINAVKQSYNRWLALKNEFEQLSSADQRDQKLDLLRFQVDELDKLAVSKEEISSLNEEHKRLANIDRLIEGCQQIMNIIDDDDSSFGHAITQAIGIINDLQSIDPALSNINELLTNAAIQLDEASNEMRHHLDGLSLDPERLQHIDHRLGLIHDIARKHRVIAEELPALYLQLSSELEVLEHSEQRLLDLQQEIDLAIKDYHRTAKKLSTCRQKIGAKLGEQATTNMQPLGMPGSQLIIDIQQQEKPTPHGIDRVEFLVSTNPNQPAKPLAKIASGGELSRLSLAIQVITSTDNSIPTMIFDEVDVGIGGGIAEIVGQKLRTLGLNSQVICVTHLPQVAAQGHTHLFVNKINDGESTSTTINCLSDKDRHQEIARMLGGISITRQTLAHAREMVRNAGQQHDDKISV